MHKLRLSSRLRLCCLDLLRRPCRPFFRRGPFCLGPAVVEPPLLASLRSPWMMFFRSIGSYSTNCLTTSPNRANTVPALERLAFAGSPRPSIDPVTPPAPPLLGALPPEAPRRVSTPVALPETPSPAEIEFLESVERYSQTDSAREQRTERVCDAGV